MRPALRYPAPFLTLSVMMMLVAPAAFAGGLRCSVGEVVLENLKIGHRYSLRKLANLPLTVANTAERSVAVAVEPMVPETSELRQNAQPVPSAAWAKAMPDTFALMPGESFQTDMVLDIPDDATLLGKRFEVVFWSHTLPDPAELVAVGLKSRVIFSIDAERDTGDAEATGDLGIELRSATFDLSHARSGKEQPLSALASQPLTVRNTSKRPLTVAISIKPTPADTRKGDGDLLTVASVRIAQTTVTLAPGEQRSLDGFLTLHAKKTPNHRYRCTVAATVRDLPVQTEIQAQLCGVTP